MHIALYPFLNKLVLPAGVIDLVANRPPADVTLLAPKASLVVRADLHPALQHLLLNAALQIHAQPGIFQKAGQFPAAESIDIPLSDEAQRFYKSGRPFFQEYYRSGLRLSLSTRFSSLCLWRLFYIRCLRYCRAYTIGSYER